MQPYKKKKRESERQKPTDGARGGEAGDEACRRERDLANVIGEKLGRVFQSEIAELLLLDHVHPSSRSDVKRSEHDVTWMCLSSAPERRARSFPQLKTTSASHHRK